MFLKEVSYAHQGWIYLIKFFFDKNSNIVNYIVSLFISVLIYFKM